MKTVVIPGARAETVAVETPTGWVGRVVSPPTPPPARDLSGLAIAFKAATPPVKSIFIVAY